MPAPTLLPGLRVSNVWLHRPARDEAWLIDCGHRADRGRLLRGLRRLGVEPAALRGLILTHRHSDHAGNARFLQQRFSVPVYAHGADAEVLSGRSPRARLQRGAGSAVAGLFAGLENRWPAPPVEVERALQDGDACAGLEVHWIPGHTAGSIFLRDAASGALLSGDSLLTAEPPLVRRPGLFLAYDTFTEDLDAAIGAVAAFHARGVEYRSLLPGHGPVRDDGIRDEVLRLLEGMTSAG